jgi:hypothetical protein
MSRIALILIWFGVLVVDGIIFPALGFIGGFGSIIFLISVLLSYGTHRWVIGWGLVVAFVTEILFGWYLGTFVLAWLSVVWTWYILNAVFSVRPAHESESGLSVLFLSVCGIGLFMVSELAGWVFVKLVYDPKITFLIPRMIVTSLSILGGVFLELMVVLSLIRLLRIKRTVWHG